MKFPKYLDRSEMEHIPLRSIKEDYPPEVFLGAFIILMFLLTLAVLFSLI